MQYCIAQRIALCDRDFGESRILSCISRASRLKFLHNGVEVMRSCVIGGWVMRLSVNYPDTVPLQEQTVLLAAEDLSHQRLCHLGHASTVRLGSPFA